jgi:hypothetical protein
MKNSPTQRDGVNETKAVAIVAIFILLLAAFRVLRAGLLPELPNFSPIAAVAFCGGLFLPGLLAWMFPIGALFASDFVLSLLIGYPPLSSAQLVSWACILGIVGFGRLAAQFPFSLPRFFSFLIGGGLFFYLVTNTAAWLANPAYPRGADGLWMSLTTGLPGFPPSWIFYRNSLVSDVIFGSILCAVWVLARRTTQEVRQLQSI